MGAPHKASTRERVCQLARQGIGPEEMARMLRGLVNRRTIQIWLSKCPSCEEGTDQ